MKCVYGILWVICAVVLGAWVLSMSSVTDTYACKAQFCGWLRLSLYVLLLPCAALTLALGVTMVARMHRLRIALKAELAMSGICVAAIFYIVRNYPAY